MSRIRSKKKKSSKSSYFDPKTSWLMYVILMLFLAIILGTAVTALMIQNG